MIVGRVIRSPIAFPALTARGRLLLTFLVVPSLMGWFAFVFVAGASELRPTDVRMPTPDVYDPYLDDFAVFYSASTLVAEGDGRAMYQLEAIHSAESRNLGVSPDSILVLPFFTPPYMVPLLLPLSLLSLGSAAIIWTLAGLASVSGAAILLTRRDMPGFTPTLACAWALAVVSSPPFFQTLLHGQTTFFLVGGWALFWAGHFRGRGEWVNAAGLVLLAHKPQLAILPIGYLLLRGDWRPLMKALFCAALLTSLTVALTGWRILPDYVRLLLNATTWDEENGISTWGMFGWNAFSRAILGEAIVARSVLTFILSLVTVAAAAISLRGSRRLWPAEPTIAILIFGSLLLSPHVYQHDVLVAAIPSFLLATSGTQRSRQAWMGYSLLGWFILYFHFDLLTGTTLNVGSLWLAAGLALAVWSLVQQRSQVCGPGGNWDRVSVLLARDTAAS